MSNIARRLLLLVVSVAVVFACAGTSMCETLDVYPGAGTPVINGDGSGDIIKVTADGCTIGGSTLQGSDDCVWVEKTLAGGEVWDLGGGFALTPVQIDVDGDKVWFSFTKDSRGPDDEIMSVGDVRQFPLSRPPHTPDLTHRAFSHTLCMQ